MKTWVGIACGALLVTTVSAAQAQDCDADCLRNIATDYMRELTTQDWSRLPWGERVRYTENNVAMMIGDGFWGAGPSLVNDGLILPDPATGNVVWFGITAEHGQAAYTGVRLQVENQRIVAVEAYHGREGTPEVFAPTADYRLDAAYTTALPAGERRSREQMVALVDGWFDTRQLNSGELHTAIAEDCVQHVNGMNVSVGEYWAAQVAQGCLTQLQQGLFKPVDRIRARRYPVIDTETGVVVALSLEDHATRYVDYTSTDGVPLKVEVEYPNTRGRLELFRLRNGAIERVDGISVFLPYYIASLWE
ncbi:MAG TPA: hypothetical protein VNR18_10595 [Hyphomicrobiales bacterium]|nr:hypothetical protein [Hyphomicrobiales bacterium]